LFPGRNQYDRYRKILSRCTEVTEIKHELLRRGIDAKDLGTHSMRKGSATYCSSGSTAGPSSSSIHLRAGWAMGGVQDTYIRYEAAGDMYVGRVACGLPLDKPEFGLVGPYFESSVIVFQAIEAVFNNVPLCLMETAANVLASLVFHSDFVQNTLPQNHPTMQSILYRDLNLLNSLKPLVRCGISGDIAISKIATGIPPHTCLLKEMKLVSEEIKQLLPSIDKITEKTVHGVDRLLENRAIGTGTVTRDGLKEILREELSKYRHLGFEPSRESNQENQIISEIVELSHAQLFTWGGRINKLPENYDLPTGTVQLAYQMWMLPDNLNRVCALRNCSAKDFSTKEKKRRFGDLAKLMDSIESDAKRDDIWTLSPNVNQVNLMVNKWWENINISTCTPKGRTRRLGQMKWTTVPKLLRINNQI
jgi:hypothetical protein